MRYAFLIMGELDARRDRACLPGDTIEMIGVADLGQACEVAQSLERAGIDCIELCGAFGEAGARAVIEATGGRIPVGFVIHLPEQDDLFAKVFPNG